MDGRHPATPAPRHLGVQTQTCLRILRFTFTRLLTSPVPDPRAGMLRNETPTRAFPFQADATSQAILT